MTHTQIKRQQGFAPLATASTCLRSASSRTRSFRCQHTAQHSRVYGAFYKRTWRENYCPGHVAKAREHRRTGAAGLNCPRASVDHQHTHAAGSLPLLGETQGGTAPTGKENILTDNTLQGPENRMGLTGQDKADSRCSAPAPGGFGPSAASDIWARCSSSSNGETKTKAKQREKRHTAWQDTRCLSASFRQSRKPPLEALPRTALCSGKHWVWH